MTLTVIFAKKKYQLKLSNEKKTFNLPKDLKNFLEISVDLVEKKPFAVIEFLNKLPFIKDKIKNIVDKISANSPAESFDADDSNILHYFILILNSALNKSNSLELLVENSNLNKNFIKPILIQLLQETNFLDMNKGNNSFLFLLALHLKEDNSLFADYLIFLQSVVKEKSITEILYFLGANFKNSASTNVLYIFDKVLVLFNPHEETDKSTETEKNRVFSAFLKFINALIKKAQSENKAAEFYALLNSELFKRTAYLDYHPITIKIIDDDLLIGYINLLTDLVCARSDTIDFINFLSVAPKSMQDSIACRTRNNIRSYLNLLESIVYKTLPHHMKHFWDFLATTNPQQETLGHLVALYYLDEIVMQYISLLAVAFNKIEDKDYAISCLNIADKEGGFLEDYLSTSLRANYLSLIELNSRIPKISGLNRLLSMCRIIELSFDEKNFQHLLSLFSSYKNEFFSEYLLFIITVLKENNIDKIFEFLSKKYSDEDSSNILFIFDNLLDFLNFLPDSERENLFCAFLDLIYLLIERSRNENQAEKMLRLLNNELFKRKSSTFYHLRLINIRDIYLISRCLNLACLFVSIRNDMNEFMAFLNDKAAFTQGIVIKNLVKDATEDMVIDYLNSLFVTVDKCSPENMMDFWKFLAVVDQHSCTLAHLLALHSKQNVIDHYVCLLIRAIDKTENIKPVFNLLFIIDGDGHLFEDYLDDTTLRIYTSFLDTVKSKEKLNPLPNPLPKKEPKQIDEFLPPDPLSLNSFPYL